MCSISLEHMVETTKLFSAVWMDISILLNKVLRHVFQYYALHLRKGFWAVIRIAKCIQLSCLTTFFFR